MSPVTITTRFEPLSLDDLNARAALLTRVDRKYIVDRWTLDAFAGAIARDFVILEIETRRVFTYDTIYFDSAALDAYHAHVQGRRRRFKVRSRRYVDSDRHVFEIKLKGRRGATVKHQLPIAPADHGAMTEDAKRFASDVLHDAYGHGLRDAILPALAMTYRRITLAARDDAERVTCDFGLSFGSAALAPGRTIVETKSERGRGAADRALLTLGVRPIHVSKYCAGIGLTHREVHANPWLAVLRRHFVTPPETDAGPPARAHAA
jgi:hypothetical protein